VTVQVERFPSLEEVQRTIEQQGFETQMFLRRLDEMRTFYLIIDSLLFSVGGVAIIIAGLGIANTLFMSVLERFREIGVFKSMGASDGDVKLLFLVEAGLIGVLGGLGGLLLGRVVSLGLEIGVNRYARSQGLEIDLAAFAFPWWLLATAMGFAVLVSVVSGLIPASRAARVDPIAALRAE
jgi:putative ABC transport system permease protein